MNWAKEVIDLIEVYYKTNGIAYNPSTNVHRCIIDFLNLELKLIKPVPRKIFISKELKKRIIPTENFLALLSIDKKVQNGSDITFHQSKKAFEPSYNDPLLNDWLIHHLHLSDWKEKSIDKFYARTKLVLFAIFSARQAFFIDVRPHGKLGEPYVFAKKELLEIIDNNWPDLLNDYRTEDVLILKHSVTDEERHKARKGGVSLGMTEVNDRVIMNPGLGIVTSGHNVMIVHKANQVIRFVQESLMEIDKDEEGMKLALSQKSGIQIKELDISIHRLDKWPYFRVYERNSKLYIDKTYENQSI
jgi:hypothetical protein